MSDPGSGLGGSGDKPQVGRPPVRNPDFYLKWGEENAKEFVKNANACLAQLLTLSSALFGGAIAFWDRLPMAVPYRYLVVFGLLTTVAVCLASAMPMRGSFDSENANDIKAHMDHVIAKKLLRMRVAQVTMFVALGLIASGLLITGTGLHAAIERNLWRT